MTEHDIMNEIRLALSEKCVVFRTNVFSGFTKDGRYVSTGVPKGYSDLNGHRKSDGRAFYIEVKTDSGEASNEQNHFIEQMKATGAIAGIVRSVEDAVRLVGGECNDS